MRNLTVQSLLSLIVTGTLLQLTAAEPVIGVAMAYGSFRANSAPAVRTATIFDGSLIETEALPSQTRLRNGVEVVLAENSAARIFQDHLALVRGTGQVAGSDYAVHAGQFRVRLSDSQAKARVDLVDKNQLRVAALNGSVEVRNEQGILLARLRPGMAMEFRPPQAGAAAATQIRGCLERRDGRYVITDETTNVTVELQGTGLENEVGNRIEVSGEVVAGATPAAGASQVVKISSMKRLARGCGAPAAAVAAGAGAGVSTAVIAGIAIAAVAGSAVALAIALREEEKAPTPVSP